VSAEAQPRKSQSLIPREHGAYAQIIFPLVTAMALGSIGTAAPLLVVAIVAVFLAHEPALVISGGRGGRAQREASESARRRLVLLLGIGLLAGALGLWLAPAQARLSALIPLALGASLALLIVRRQEKTAVGELLVSLTLSATLIPVAMAGGVSFQASVAAATVWAVAFALATITVRGIIARAKKNAEPGLAPIIASVLSAAAIAISLFLALSGRLPVLVAVAVVPTALVAMVFGVLGVHPRNLRRMGWSLVLSNIAVLAALIIGFN
jgi:hypothetical protein